MKPIYFIVFLASISIHCLSQSTDSLQNLDDIILDQPLYHYETEPEFPGGVDSLWCFIESNLNFGIVNSSKTHGKILAFFEIDTLGKVINIVANPDYIHHLDYLVKDSLIESEIHRTLSIMPDWAPGYIREKPVKCQYVIPIIIPYKDFKCKAL